MSLLFVYSICLILLLVAGGSPHLQAIDSGLCGCLGCGAEESERTIVDGDEEALWRR
ncbi:hypothetical protein BVRB_8g183120 [Beta vulgaris subsp. vulgaris]|nr:hypothetical protein BVRB_8g183120 [Beta vulgaris subsp. vulgaris]